MAKAHSLTERAAAQFAFTRLGESLRAQVNCLESRALDWVGDSSMPGEDGRLRLS